MRKRPQLRLYHIENEFVWNSKERKFDPDVTDPLYTVWCSRHDTRDEAIDYYNKVLEDFNAENN